MSSSSLRRPLRRAFSFCVFPLLVLAGASSSLVGCGGYYTQQKVERPALVALPAEVKTFELVDVHLADGPETLPELLANRAKVLPHLRRSAKNILGLDAEMHPTMIAASPPIADALKSCVSTDLNGSGKPSWKIAAFVSEHSSGSPLSGILGNSSYMVTVRLVLWDAEMRQVDRTTITFTKSSGDGGTHTHYDFPDDDDVGEGGSLDAFGDWKVDDPLWLRGVVSAFDMYLKTLRPSRKVSFVRKGETYREPQDRVQFRKAHAERPLATRCQPVAVSAR